MAEVDSRNRIELGQGITLGSIHSNSRAASCKAQVAAASIPILPTSFKTDREDERRRMSTGEISDLKQMITHKLDNFASHSSGFDTNFDTHVQFSSFWLVLPLRLI